MEVNARLIVDYFQYKYVTSVHIISDWSLYDKILMTKSLSSYGILVSHNANGEYINMTYDYFKHDYNNIGILHDVNDVDENYLIKVANDKLMRSQYIWLFLYKDESDEIESVLGRLELYIDADITLAKMDANNSIELYDLYNPGKIRGGLVNITKIGKWTPNEGLVMSEYQDRYSNRRRDVHGIAIRAVTVAPRRGNASLSDHLVDRTKPYDDSLSKVGYDLVILLRDFFNLTIILSETFSWGDPGVTGMFRQHQSDISATTLRFITPRLEYLENVYQIWEFRTSYVFLNPQYVGSISNTFFKPFSGAIWGSTVATVIVATVLLAISCLQETRESFCAPISAVFTSILTVLGALTQQGTDLVPRRTSGRVVFILIFTFSMLLYNFYTSSIVSSLLSDKKSLINSIKELADSDMNIGIENIAYNKVQYESELTDELRYLLNKKTNRHPMLVKKFYMNLEDGVDQLQRGGFAFNAEVTSLYDRMAKRFQPNQLCQLNEIGVMPKIKLSVVSLRGSPFTKMFKIGALRVAECGLTSRCVKIFRAARPECQAGGEPQAVGGAQAAPALLLLLMGAVLSLMILTLELVIYRRGNRSSGHFRTWAE